MNEIGSNKPLIKKHITMITCIEINFLIDESDHYIILKELILKII